MLHLFIGYLTISFEGNHKPRLPALRPKLNGHYLTNSLESIFWYENCCGFRCHSNLFPSLQLTITNIGSYNRLVPNRRQAIIWTNDGQVYWCTHASPSLNELTVTKLRFFVFTVGLQVVYCDIAVITVCNNKRRGMICNRHLTTHFSSLKGSTEYSPWIFRDTNR